VESRLRGRFPGGAYAQGPEAGPGGGGQERRGDAAWRAGRGDLCAVRPAGLRRQGFLGGARDAPWPAGCAWIVVPRQVSACAGGAVKDKSLDDGGVTLCDETRAA